MLYYNPIIETKQQLHIVYIYVMSFSPAVGEYYALLNVEVVIYIFEDLQLTRSTAVTVTGGGWVDGTGADIDAHLK